MQHCTSMVGKCSAVVQIQHRRFTALGCALTLGHATSALNFSSSRKPDVEAKNGGDIGLNGSAKVSNHSDTNTMHEVSGDIGLTKAAKESNHS